jgi:hypothetical protein
LPILQVEDRKSPLLLLQVLLRQIYCDSPIAGKNLRVKLVNVVPGVGSEIIYIIYGSFAHLFAGRSLAFCAFNRVIERIF